jgi:membrane-associated phospholipid phosphatase
MDDIVIRILADGLVIPIVLIGAWALIFKIKRGEHYASYCRILLAGLTAYLFAKLIASVFQPELERPFELLGVTAGATYLNNPGFPSDHVLFCAAITLAVWFETRDRRLAGLLGILTCLVAAGRVAALVHSPLDVVGGVAIACIGGIWYLQRERPVHPIAKRQWSKPKKSGTIS